MFVSESRNGARRSRSLARGRGAPPGGRSHVKRVASALGAAALVAGAVVAVPSAAQAAPAPLEWNSPGSHSWTVPEGVTEVGFEIAGGAGGNRYLEIGLHRGGHPGGRGALITGTMPVTPGSSLTLYVGAAGVDGEPGGGGDSYGPGGRGWHDGGDGGTGSNNGTGTLAQGGGGGGGSSYIGSQSGSLSIEAGGGGGAGGFGHCGGNPGGDSGQNAWKESKNCATDGGDPGIAGAMSSGTGGDGEDAGTLSGRGGGGGGGGGYRGGSGGEHSSDGGGGGGGGTSFVTGPVTVTGTTVGSYHSNGYIKLLPVYSTQTAFDHETYSPQAGQDFEVSGTVGYVGGGASTPPQGTVTVQAHGADSDPAVEIGTATLDGGEFSLTCTAPCGVPADATQLRAVYAPLDTGWRASEATAALAVDPAPTLTSLDIDTATAVTGQPVEMTATVEVQAPAIGPATGAVEFWTQPVTGGADDSVLLGEAEIGSAGRAVLETSTPVMGEQRVWATYPGDGWFETSTSPKRALTIAQADTEISVAALPEPTVTGQAYTLQLDVSAVAPGTGTPGGEVTVSSDGISETLALTDGSAQLQLPGETVGTRDFTIEYTGDERYLGSAANYAHTIDPAATAVELTQSAETSGFGEAVELTATAIPVSPGEGLVSGDVELLIDGEASGIIATLTDATAIFEVGGLETGPLGAGSHTFEAAYLGSVDAKSATSNALTHEVIAADSIVELSTPRETMTVGTDATLTVRVTADTGVSASGIVELRSGVEPADGDEDGSENGTDEAGAGEPGTDETGTDETGTDEAAPDATDPNGTEDQGDQSDPVNESDEVDAPDGSDQPDGTEQPDGTGQPSETDEGEGVLVAQGELVDGVVEFVLEQPELGDHRLTAVYLGSDDVVAGSSQPVSFEVVQATSTTSVTVPAEAEAETEAEADEPVSLTATVSAHDTSSPEAAARLAAAAFGVLGADEEPGAEGWRPFAPEGEVQFVVDGEEYGDPVPLSAAPDAGAHVAEAVLVTTLAPRLAQRRGPVLGRGARGRVEQRARIVRRCGARGTARR